MKAAPVKAAPSKALPKKEETEDEDEDDESDEDESEDEKVCIKIWHHYIFIESSLLFFGWSIISIVSKFYFTSECFF